MPWKEACAMSLREEFVVLASQPGANVSALARGFGISRKTGYKWLARYCEVGRLGLQEHSRRPHCSPERTSAGIEEAVVDLRRQHPAWGGRKLRVRLQRLGHLAVPAASTITAILRRHKLLDPAESARHRACQRFEHERPNDLWQMDFKGDFSLDDGRRCHPLTVLDDHSRYALAVEACGNQQTATVRARLTGCFRRYGLPCRMLMDNGSPWGDDRDHPYTPLTVWLLRLGVGVTHGRPYHPQTQGKDERFHRTLKTELLGRHRFRNLVDCQRKLDPWRDQYNLVRPHEALGMTTPAERYEPSRRLFPEVLPAIEYDSGCHVRQVQSNGCVSYGGRRLRVSKGFRSYPVGLRPSDCDGELEVWFCDHRVGRIDLHEAQPRLRLYRRE